MSEQPQPQRMQQSDGSLAEAGLAGLRKRRAEPNCAVLFGSEKACLSFIRPPFPFPAGRGRSSGCSGGCGED